MPVTTLDPKTALIVIDLQKGIVNRPTVHSMAGIIANSVRLIDSFRQKNLPIALVNVTGAPSGRTQVQRPMGDLPADWAELIAELRPQTSDIKVTKRSWGAFSTTDLAEKLRDLGVTQVVIIGVATSIGVESTARHAHELGFNVTLVSDAMTDMVKEAHDNSLNLIFPRLGEVGTTDDIVHLLSTRA